MSKRVKSSRYDSEVHSRHLKRQLESLEKDNHQSLNDVEGLINIALAAQEDESNISQRKSRARTSNIYSTRTNLNALLEETPVTTYCYQTCQVKPSIYPARNFCSVCGFPSHYTCLRCGMKYCSTKCLTTHTETRCLKWTA
ncbi:uncharacterized protein BX663DRAFT_551995 [Cokeromyces recurvatus]|uniref:uncharacterized protein n=1 Tax=Cokeromyces recurvatus TaxID=90255 RepID=UPI00221E9B59|nr:uncharacterized protein BX663DRAFT_551995 [Cokeromyces recurvatus]KAI7902584.1 hypothetical protein BX663DRAFT_551995 [Cokeromyces recurvatus]